VGDNLRGHADIDKRIELSATWSTGRAPRAERCRTSSATTPAPTQRDRVEHRVRANRVLSESPVRNTIDERRGPPNSHCSAPASMARIRRHRWSTRGVATTCATFAIIAERVRPVGSANPTSTDLCPRAERKRSTARAQRRRTGPGTVALVDATRGSGDRRPSPSAGPQERYLLPSSVTAPDRDRLRALATRSSPATSACLLRATWESTTTSSKPAARTADSMGSAAPRSRGGFLFSSPSPDLRPRRPAALHRTGDTSHRRLTKEVAACARASAGGRPVRRGPVRVFPAYLTEVDR